MLTNDSGEEAYKNWKSSWERDDPELPGPSGYRALYYAGLLFSKKPDVRFTKDSVPSMVRDELIALIANTDWSSSQIKWLPLGNFVGNFLNLDKPLLKASHDAKIPHRLALSYAMLLDRTEKKINQRFIFKNLRMWESKIPKSLNDIDNVVSELIRVWGGDDRAEKWISLIKADKEWNDKELQLDKLSNENVTNILNFALYDMPLRTQSEHVANATTTLDSFTM